MFSSSLQKIGLATQSYDIRGVFKKLCKVDLLFPNQIGRAHV